MSYIFPKSLLVLIVLFSCERQNEVINGGQKPILDYDLLYKNNSIWVERLDTSKVDQNKYNSDNFVYKPKKGFKYSYSLMKNRKEFCTSDFSENWRFLECIDSIDIQKEFVLEVIDGNPMTTYMPYYNQTNIFYKYTDGSNSITGVVENSKNLWMHPPRAGVFRLLEILPFPYVKFPIKVGDKYAWKLTIGDHYADSSLVYWTGSIENKMSYQVKSIDYLKTEFGALKCAKVNAKAESRIGISMADFWYNQEYGFVKMRFEALDSSILILELNEVYEVKDPNLKMTQL